MSPCADGDIRRKDNVTPGSRRNDNALNAIDRYCEGQIVDGFGENTFVGKGTDGKDFWFCFL